MRILIREVTRKTGDSMEHRDAPFEGDVVSIGRATDQVIQLQDKQLALSHSELRAAGKALAIKSVGDEHFFVNGSRSRSARLSDGDVVEIGNVSITVQPAPEGYDFAVDVEAGEKSEQEAAFGSQFLQSLDATAVSKRSASWTLIVVILATCLVVPAVGMLDRGLGIALRDAPVPDDGLWLSGPMHSSHQFMGDDCTACHVEPFVMTQDEQCVACHTSMTHHVDASVHDIPELEGQRCASCHKEHNEPTVLSRSDQGLCSDCHADLQSSTSAPVELADVSDFGDDHPEFKLSMLRGEGLGEAMSWEIERVALDEPGLVEESNLIFPHDVHMDPQGVDGPAGGVVMECSDCHQPEAGGAYMRPISMEQHCSDCHLLTFDGNNPDREVPHGEPDEILPIMEEYYARQILAGTGRTVDSAAFSRPARRPGEAGRERNEPQPVDADAVVAQALEEASRRAMQSARDIFERTTCKTCHEVDRVDDPDLRSPWQVQPVRIAQVWMPKAWFDHQAHVTEECARCHGAENSTTAADVLMPPVESCRDCHGGEDATNRLASTCVECHVFHIPGLALMKPDVPGSVAPETPSDLARMRADEVDQLTPVRAN
jgi:predicted CXXCH cytochrome family protein